MLYVESFWLRINVCSLMIYLTLYEFLGNALLFRQIVTHHH